MADFGLPAGAILALAKSSIHDRIVGCLFGSALGDAIGLYTEFLPGHMTAIAYPDRKFVLHPLGDATRFRSDRHRDPHWPGEWTDDTDHAMLILLSSLHKDCKELDPQDFASRLLIWVQMGLRALDTLPLGLGRTVGSIVRNKNYLDDPEGIARLHWKNLSYNVAPNGSLMRTHTLGLLCLDKTLEKTFDVAADYSVVTHVDPRCIISCAIGTALVRGLVRQEVRVESDIDGIADNALVWWRGYRERQLQKVERKDEPDLDIAELRRHMKVNNLSDLLLDEAAKIGYVYKTLGSGIHLLRMALRRTAANNGTLSNDMELFEPLITDLIMHGGDADTNACFAGALLGAFIGYKALPLHWRDGLIYKDWLMEKAEGLCQMLEVVDGTYKGSDDKETAPDGGRGLLTNDEIEMKVMLLQANMARRERERQNLENEEAETKKKGRRFRWLKWRQSVLQHPDNDK